MKKIWLMAALMSSPLLHWAQVQCGFDHVQEELLKNTAYQIKTHQQLDTWKKHMEVKSKSAARPVVENNDTIYELPVVIHVIHTGDTIGSIYNPTDLHLESWINYLNEVYAATHASVASTSNGGVAIPIRFILAKRDPDSNTTNGIVRYDASTSTSYLTHGVGINTYTNGVHDTILNSWSQWPIEQYYNIYVVSRINGEDGFNTSKLKRYTAGYAHFPSAPLLSNDGAYVLAYNAKVGDITLPHEIGHALGLKHTFQGAIGSFCFPESDCSTEGDWVCDTEQTKNLTGTCPTSTTYNPCTGANYNGVQYNFMSYSTCPNRFTYGQKELMLFNLTTYREGLLTSSGLDSVMPSVELPESFCYGILRVPRNHKIGGFKSIRLGKLIYNIKHNFSKTYTDHTLSASANGSFFTPLLEDEEHTISLTTQEIPQQFKGYIDYNNDGIFDENELFVQAKNVAPHSTIQKTFRLPAGKITGKYLRMRIVSDLNEMELTACSDLQQGEAHDFAVMILNNPLKNNNSIQKITCYPNPNSGTVNLSLPKPISTKIHVQVFDVTNKLVANFGDIDGEILHHQFDISKLSSGMYYIKVNGTDLQQTLRIVKH